MRKFDQLRGLVLALSGADSEVLRYVPSERTRFESLGWAILITSGMAMLSMWFALSSALGVNGIVAVPVAVFWGLVIMGIDRWLITSMPIEGSRKFAMAVPRVLLAILLGTLISTPLVLRIFQSEINAQMAVMQQKNYSSFLSSQQSSQVNQQVTTYYNELQQLDTVINSKGAQTGNTAADPELLAYNKQLTQLQGELSHWTTLKGQYYTDYTCQMYGGAQCPKKGDGPAAKASYASYQQASQEVTSYQAQISHVQQEIQQRDQFLNSTSASSQQQRYSEALNQRPVVQAEYTTAVQRRNELQAAYYAQDQASHGILMRLEALSELSGGNFTVQAARFLLFLLFLVIECLPVTVKLLQRPGQYEAALAAAKKAEKRDYEKFFSTRSRLRQAAFAPDGQGPGRPGQPQGAGAMPLNPEPQAGGIWFGTSRLPALTDSAADEVPTDVHPVYPEGRRAGYVPSVKDTRREHRWHGGEEWLSNWVPQDQDEQVREDRPGRDAAGYRGAETRLDPLAASTKPDYGAGSDRPGTLQAADDGPDYADAYRETTPLAVDASRDHGAPDHQGDQVPAWADDNGAGIPLSWDDE